MPIPYDKRIHFAVCFLITFLLYPLIGWFGAGTAMLTGIGKELFDFDDYGVFSWGDILADVLGVALAVIILILIKI